MSIKRHTAYNVVGAIVPLLATLATLPVYIRTIGEDRYGVLIILWTLLGYFGLFDLGLGQAVTNRIAALKDQSVRERAEVFWTALVMNFVLGCVGALVLWVAGEFIFRYFIDLPSALTREVYAALPWMVVAFPLLLVSSVMGGALKGREEFLVQNAATVVTGLLIQIAPLIVALAVGPALGPLVVAVVSARIFGAFMLYGLCVQRLPVGFRPLLARRHVRPLVSFGGWITVSGIVAPLLTTLDRVIIGAVLGAQMVTYYAVPFNLATRVTILPGALASALFPRFSGQEGAESDLLLFRSTRLLVVVMLPPIVLGLWLMEPFLTWWMGPAFAIHAARTGQWIVLGLWMNVFAYPSYVAIQARGRPDVVAKLQLAQVVPYLVLLWVGLTKFGVVGGAAVWAMGNTVDATLLILLARVDKRVWSVVLQSFGFLSLGAILALRVQPLSAPSFIGLVGLLAAISFWVWRNEPSLISGLRHRLNNRHVEQVVY